MANPLQKYFRQPKIYINLPSKGMYYPEGAFIGDHSSVPIFGMTGMDELIMKTPDALFSGEATVKLIESCCPYIKDGGSIPSLDIDTLLVAIRIATYGDKLTLTSKCSSCNSENDYEIKLNEVLEHYNEKNFNNQIKIGELTVNLKPLSYRDLSKINIENFKLQKMLAQVASAEISEEDRRQYIDDIYKNLAKIQLEVLLLSIESITTEEDSVTDKEYIKEWLSNTISESYNLIKDRLEENKKEWSMPAREVKCVDCGHTNHIEFSLDQSNFFE